ncbi:MAG: carboxypeptidase regulatory-like domain-containing protein, partial [Sphingobacteriaceae bacterium]
MKNLYLMIVLLLPFAAVTAKTKSNEKYLLKTVSIDAAAAITGTVVDSASGKPVDYSTISVLNQQSGKVVSGTLADANGKFSIGKLEAGVYQVKISFIGYENKIISNLKIADGASLKLGKILLHAQTKSLKEVQITGKKDLIEEKIDRTVYNAENDLTTRGGDATDVMKRVPMVSVD